MSNSGQVVLREYLLSLGFKADPVSQSKFIGLLGGIDKRVLGIGKGLAGVASAAAGMVAGFTTAMEKAYYASRLGQSSVSSMQAAAFAGKQIGLTAEQVNGAILNMSMAIRQNPGVQALIESFGVPVEGRDMADVITDVVAELRKLPFSVSSKLAGEMGLDPQTFFLLAEGLEKYNAAQRKRKEITASAGVDEDKFAEVSVRYKNALGEIIEKVEILGKKLAIRLLPMFEKLNDIINKSLDFWIKWSSKLDDFVDKVEKINKWFREKASWNPLMRWFFNQVDPQPGVELTPRHRMSGVLRDAPSTNHATGGGVDFGAIEQRYGLPAGLLDRMWSKESARGKYMLSPKGAQGHFGFMPGTATEYGVNNPNDLGQSADGAARYMSALYKKYGDWGLALAAYNWGPGNLDSKGLSAMPAETRDYMKMREGLNVGGPQTTIIIQGAQDPADVANRVEQAQDRVNAEYVRNLGAVIQ